MDELLEQLGAQHDVPAPLLERAAAARAQASGISTEDLVRRWAGVEADAPPAQATPQPASPSPAAAAPAPAPVETPEDTGTEDDAAVEVLEPTAAPPVPHEEEEEEQEPQAPEPLGGVPGWLAAAFALIPILAVMYALSVPNGPDCGSSGQLQVDPVTGTAVNCDGSAYGSTEGNLLAAGQVLYDASCAACHGASGGGGAGPALNGGAVLDTFSMCSDHIAWVSLGTSGWEEPTYGDNERPVGGFGQMPGFGAQFTDEDLAAVSVYERVAFGGEDRDEALVNCASGDEVTALGRGG